MTVDPRLQNKDVLSVLEVFLNREDAQLRKTEIMTAAGLWIDEVTTHLEVLEKHGLIKTLDGDHESRYQLNENHEIVQELQELHFDLLTALSQENE